MKPDWKQILKILIAVLTALAGATVLTDLDLSNNRLQNIDTLASLPVLTAAATSMAALTEAQFNDVGMFDFSLPYVPSDNTNFRSAVTAFLLVCLKLKIPVLQNNTINPELLEEERDHKGTHPELVVRVCGYSALFTELSRDMQDEIIERLSVTL